MHTICCEGGQCRHGAGLVDRRQQTQPMVVAKHPANQNRPCSSQSNPRSRPDLLNWAARKSGQRPCVWPRWCHLITPCVLDTSYTPFTYYTTIPHEAKAACVCSNDINTFRDAHHFYRRPVQQPCMATLQHAQALVATPEAKVWTAVDSKLLVVCLLVVVRIQD